jgi:hypothetical protein
LRRYLARAYTGCQPWRACSVERALARRMPPTHPTRRGGGQLRDAAPTGASRGPQYGRGAIIESGSPSLFSHLYLFRPHPCAVSAAVRVQPGPDACALLLLTVGADQGDCAGSRLSARICVVRLREPRSMFLSSGGSARMHARTGVWRASVACVPRFSVASVYMFSCASTVGRAPWPGVRPSTRPGLTCAHVLRRTRRTRSAKATWAPTALRWVRGSRTTGPCSSPSPPPPAPRPGCPRRIKLEQLGDGRAGGGGGGFQGGRGRDLEISGCPARSAGSGERAADARRRSSDD